ncbi:MAG: hypothetical protein K0Q43_105 [Ramlibacter sp.]|jgi:hypothetical protein|nr:hypothetical protein [Ramlibacter sp.]
MQVAPQRQASGEPFAAAIARRMLSQGASAAGRDVPEAELESLRTRAAGLAPGISLSRASVTQGLAHQQIMAATSIENLWAGDADMQLIARETSAKAIGGLQSTADADGEDDAEGDASRPRG